jgi:hypothetical protein
MPRKHRLREEYEELAGQITGRSAHQDMKQTGRWTGRTKVKVVRGRTWCPTARIQDPKDSALILTDAPERGIQLLRLASIPSRRKTVVMGKCREGR